MTDADRPTSPSGPTRPTGAARRFLLVVFGIVAVEALGLVTLAVLDLTDLNSDRLGLGVGAALLLAVYAAAMVWAAVRVLRGHSWGRGFLVLTQLIQVLIAYNARDNVWWVPTLLATTGVVALGCLLAPPVTAALVDDPEAL
ncbi:hypothetical protein ASD11_09345 [Aeromicrobium sp. Root495]|uniref:hypothetical protein n=1 Tax=Aeromicrobium sp. Root495 TaxID=1736550 RepID=UPI0006F3FC80|nr:hypothetical protein [Aeromicrobium sp. Root495]KQY59732.1 hypothetical protein ASD11_09345 [Aeromicrobium sp. Root495]